MGTGNKLAFPFSLMFFVVPLGGGETNNSE